MKKRDHLRGLTFLPLFGISPRWSSLCSSVCQILNGRFEQVEKRISEAEAISIEIIQFEKQKVKSNEEG